MLFRSKKLPSREVVLETTEGEYYHFKTDIFSGMMTYSLGRSGTSALITIHKDRVYEVIGLNRKGVKPNNLQVETEEKHKRKEVYGGDSLNEDSLTRFDNTVEAKPKRNKRKSSSRRRNRNNRNKNRGSAQDEK